MSTATRHKYRYASRQEAEDKVVEVDQEHHKQLRLARALYAGKVTWMPTPAPSAYRVGVFDLDTCGGPRIVTAFQPIVQGRQQEPSLTVYDLYGREWEEYREWFYHHYYRADDKEAVHLRNALDAAQAAIYAHERSATR